MIRLKRAPRCEVPFDLFMKYYILKISVDHLIAFIISVVFRNGSLSVSVYPESSNTQTQASNDLPANKTQIQNKQFHLCPYVSWLLASKHSLQSYDG